jgi:hypothetical protein
VAREYIVGTIGEICVHLVVLIGTSLLVSYYIEHLHSSILSGSIHDTTTEVVHKTGTNSLTDEKYGMDTNVLNNVVDSAIEIVQSGVETIINNITTTMNENGLHEL